MSDKRTGKQSKGHDSRAGIARQATAHVYCRVSTGMQSDGDGLRRQGAMGYEQFAARNGYALSKKIWIDDGVSAFHGLNLSPEHQLGQFLRAAERGVDVCHGDCLLVENWDRISRLDVWAAIGFIGALRTLGISIARMDTGRHIRYDSPDLGDFFDFSLEAARGHGESSRKSDMIGAHWEECRRRAENERGLLQGPLPAWLSLSPSEESDPEARLRLKKHKAEWVRFRVKPEAEEAIRLIFQLARQGAGQITICRELQRRAVAPIARGAWNGSYVAKLLTDRRLIGELTLRSSVRPKKLGGHNYLPSRAVKGYFPAVLTPEEFSLNRPLGSAVRAVRGRESRRVNLFKGLLYDITSLSAYVYSAHPAHRKGNRDYYVPLAAMNGRAECRLLDAVVFEQEYLRWLREVDVMAALGNQSENIELASAEQAVASAEREVEALSAELAERGYSRALADRLRTVEAALSVSTAELARLRQRAAHPLSGVWAEQTSVIDALANAPDPLTTRIRLRGLLRETISRIDVLMVKRGVFKVIVAETTFGGAALEQRRRTHIIVHKRREKTRYYESPASVASGSDCEGIVPASASLASDWRSIEESLLSVPRSALVSACSR